MESDGWWWKANQVAAVLLRRSDREMEPPSICLIGAINWWNRLKEVGMGELTLFTHLYPCLSPYLSTSNCPCSRLLSSLQSSLHPSVPPSSCVRWRRGEENVQQEYLVEQTQSDNGLSYFWNKQWYCASERQGWWLDQKERIVGGEERGRQIVRVGETIKGLKKRRWDTEKGDKSRKNEERKGNQHEWGRK